MLLLVGESRGLLEETLWELVIHLLLDAFVATAGLTVFCQRRCLLEIPVERQHQEVGASHSREVSTAARRQRGASHRSSRLEPLRLFWVFQGKGT